MRATLSLLCGLAGLVAARTDVTGVRSRWLELRAGEGGDVAPVQTDFYSQKHSPEQFFRVPVDHFHNESEYAPHSNSFFGLRYWFDASSYETGGPVFVFASGETDASSRLPILQTGIIADLARATKGMGVILEHRYYGKSQPTPNLSTENLRFLTTSQALADTAYFAQNVVFEGFESENLTSSAVPWIIYGGSYGGAFAAMQRKLYPDVYFGAIASSAVVEAIIDYWQYYDAVRQYAPQACMQNLQYLVDAMDNIFTQSDNNGSVPVLKDAFGLGGLTHNDDMMNILSLVGPADWQDLNWNPAVSYDGTYEFCDAVGNQSLQYPDLENMTDTAQSLLAAGGYGSAEQLQNLTVPFLNWMGLSQNEIAEPCLSSPNRTLDGCYGTYHHEEPPPLKPAADRNWPYQVCTQWAFFTTGNAPADDLPIVSRLLTVEYSMRSCNYSFGITTLPDVQLTNDLGGFNFSYPRLAFVDGEWDPWRPATVHASAAPPRPSTANEPAWLIPDAVHHWDENGVAPNETTPDFPPPDIQQIQRLEVQWVKQWLQEWETS